MLYEADRHVALKGKPWHEAAAQSAIDEIVADAEAAFRGETLWPGHPLETFPRDGSANLYWGAAGVIWALHRLSEWGAAASVRDYSSIAAGLYEGFAAHENTIENPAYMIGATGVVFAEHLFAPSSSALERLGEAVEASLETPPDLCFGAPGAMVVANYVYRQTGDSLWRALVERHVDRLWSAWSHAPDAGCHLWKVHLQFPGMPAQEGGLHIGACHGLAGNVMALLQVTDLLPETDRDLLYRRCVEAYEKTAVREAGCANWWRSVGNPGWGENQLLVQWCYGAPGMVTAMRAFPSAEQVGGSASMDELLREAGELTWRAGPLGKGAGLCHGTAGNGYALLAMFERTGDRRWLERARAFAMHAIEQCRDMRRTHGRGRYALWTGDLGVAVYVWQCMRERAGMPTLDVI